MAAPISSLAIIGVGNMGTAMFKAWRQAFPTLSIHLCDHKLDYLEELVEDDHTEITDSPAEAINHCAVVVLAIKPQGLSEFAGSINADIIGEDKLVISILAGTSLASLAEVFPKQQLVRAMPNLAVQTQKAVIGYYSEATPDVTAKCEQLFQPLSLLTVKVESESQLDALTALSGSGPAYFYLLTELLADAASKLGLPPELATATFLGASSVLLDSDLTAAELRQAITSKGGTTAAALAEFQDRGLAETVEAAVRAAQRRAGELGRPGAA